MNKKTEKLVCKTTVIKQYGWTETMIKKFMPEPDKEVDNPYYKCASKMKLYAEKRVKRIQRTKRFLAAMALAAKRKASSKRAVSTRRDNIVKWAQNVPIDIPPYDKEELLGRAIASYNRREARAYESRCEYRLHHDYSEDGGIDQYLEDEEDDFCRHCDRNSNKEFLKRITTNYLRHECTDYEYDLHRVGRIYGMVVEQEVHDILQKRINEKILETYEWLR